jgi:hypothetical protein
VQGMQHTSAEVNIRDRKTGHRMCVLNSDILKKIKESRIFSYERFGP